MGKTKTAFIDDSVAEVTKVAKAAKDTKATSEKENVIPNPPAGGEESVNKEQIATLKQAFEAVSPQAESVQGKLPRDDGSKKAKKTKASKASQKKGKAKYRSVKYKEAAEKAEKSKRYPVIEAIDLAKQTSYSKFDGSLELHL